MNKKEKHTQDLVPLIGAYLEQGNMIELTDYLLDNSNLPGRRGNLELAAVFGDLMAERASTEASRLWQLCLDYTNITANLAPVNTPEEFLPFCGTVGIGAIGSTVPTYFDQALTRLRHLADDPRWRMREAVCFAVQRLMAVRSQETLRALEVWAQTGSYLQMRAVAGSVADPPNLKDREVALASLRLHEMIFERVLEVEDRKDEDFRTLRKALAYSLSVVICAAPEAGFELMKRLAATGDSDVRWIIRQNLKKNRLNRSFPQEVDLIQELID